MTTFDRNEGKMNIKVINDKVLHFTAGFLIALLAGCILDPITGFLTAAIIGAAKEIWDYFGHGTSDRDDLIATVQGGVIGCLLLILLRMLG